MPRAGWMVLVAACAACEQSPIEGLISGRHGGSTGFPDAASMIADPPVEAPSDAGFEPPPPDAGFASPADSGSRPADAGVVRPPDAGVVRPPDAGPAQPPTGTAEEQMLVLVNGLRAMGTNCGARRYAATTPLRMDDKLQAAARDHSVDMATNNYFSHTSQDGRSPFQRMSAAGYTGSPLGENIAAGNADAQSTFRQWVTSSGHCQNMMNPGATEIGVGYGSGTRGYRHYWTQTFGRR